MGTRCLVDAQTFSIHEQRDSLEMGITDRPTDGRTHLFSEKQEHKSEKGNVGSHRNQFQRSPQLRQGEGKRDKKKEVEPRKIDGGNLGNRQR